MLGNKDEYGTVDGTDWDQASDDEQSVMRKGDLPVRRHHFKLITEAIAASKAFDGEVKSSKIGQSSGGFQLPAVRA